MAGGAAAPNPAVAEDQDYEYLPPKAAPAKAAPAPTQAAPSPSQSDDEYEYLPSTPAPSSSQPPEQPQLKPNNDRGPLASVKRTLAFPGQVYHAATDDPTPEETARIQQGRSTMPGTVDNSAPSVAEKLGQRLIAEPRQQTIDQAGQQFDQARRDWKQGKGIRAANDLLSSATTRGLAEVPIVGPWINSEANRIEGQDYSGAATDLGTSLLAEHALPKAAEYAKQTVRELIPRTDTTAAAPLTRPTPNDPRAAAIAKVRDAAALEQAHESVAQALPPSKSAPWEPEDMQRSRPYLEEQNRARPIRDVVGMRDAADAGIGNIENKVAEYIAYNPQDTIDTEPLRAVQRDLAGHAREDFASQGVNELESLNLDQPLTVERADQVRRQLNAENKGVLQKNNYDRATARAVDPGFAAREIAAEQLRDGIYGKLEERGIPAIDELRRDEGSLIKVRNAAESAKYRADKAPPGQGGGLGTGMAKFALRKVLPGFLADAVLPDPLTRDQLIARSFAHDSGARPIYPSLPPRPEIAGQLEAPKHQMPQGPGPHVSGPINPEVGRTAEGGSMPNPEWERGRPVYPGEPARPEPLPQSRQLGRAPIITAPPPEPPEVRPQPVVHEGTRASRLGLLLGEGRTPIITAPPAPGAMNYWRDYPSLNGPDWSAERAADQAAADKAAAKPAKGSKPASPQAKPLSKSAAKAEPAPQGKTAPATDGKPVAKPLSKKATAEEVKTWTDTDQLRSFVDDAKNSTQARQAALDRYNRLRTQRGEIPKVGSAESLPAAAPKDGPLGEGTSSVMLVEGEAPKTNMAQEVQSHTAEIARAQDILRNPAATAEDQAYAQKALESSLELRRIAQEQAQAEAPKAKKPPQEKPEYLSRTYTDDEKERYQGEMEGMLSLAGNFERPGRYFDQFDQPLNQASQDASKGTLANGQWRGVKSSKHMVAGQYPWFSDEAITESRVTKALQRPGGADWKYIMDAIARSHEGLEEPPF